MYARRDGKFCDARLYNEATLAMNNGLRRKSWKNISETNCQAADSGTWG